MAWCGNFSAVRPTHPALSYSSERYCNASLAHMHFLLSFVLICSFFILIIAGLISVLRDMLWRSGPDSPPAAALNLDLSPDLDHPLRRQIEPVHDLRGVAIQEGK